MANKTVYPYGTGGSLPSSIGLVNDLETGGVDNALTAEQGKFLGSFLFGKSTAVPLSGITESNYSLGTVNWGGTSGKHKVVPVNASERYTLKVTASSGNGGFYGYLTGSYVVPSSPSDSVPFVSGTSRLWLTTNASVEITIPTGCEYLCICTKDGAGKSADWSLTKHYNDYNDTFKEKLNEIDGIRESTYTYILSPIDISDAVPQSCSLGSTVWYLNANSPMHIAVPVDGSSVIELKLIDCGGSTSFYTFVTSSYSPPVTNGATIPFANGLSERSSLNRYSSVTLNVPENAAYLILTIKDGGGNVASWSVAEKTEITLDEAFREYSVHVGDRINVDVGVPVKLKVATWNVGGFSLGKSGSPTITPANLDEMRSKWRSAINNLGADVLCCCEYNTNFMDEQDGNDAIAATDAVFTNDVFAYTKVGPEVAANSYMQTAIFANTNLETSQIVYFQHTVQQGRYYQITETHIAGKLVKILSVHLDFSNTDAEDDSSRIVRRQQIEELIAKLAENDHVIICGDFNVNKWAHRSDYDLFVDAGYKMVNHDGYLGDILTYPSGDTDTGGVLDNIIYKGFVANKVGVLNDATLSDHKCLFADLTFI